MSVKRKKVVQPAREYEQVVSITCDICGVEHEGGSEDAEGVNWGKTYDNIDATGVYLKKGYNCPSGGSHETNQYHVCPPCMRLHVMPFIAGLTKNKPSTYEVDW